MAEFRIIHEAELGTRKGQFGGDEQARVQVWETDGPTGPVRGINVRHFWQNAEGDWCPSKQGVTIRPRELDALEQALGVARGRSSSTPPSPAAARTESPRRAEAPKAAAGDRRNGFDASRGRKMTSQRPSTCVECGEQIEPGDLIVYDGQAKRAAHAECVDDDDDSGPVGEAARRVASGAGRQRPLFSGEGCIT
jgi:hypothetical protein